jgi:hypothetical protein
METKLYTYLNICSLFLLLTLCSCAVPQAVIRVEPNKDEDVRWNYGQAIAEKSEDGLQVSAMFNSYDRKYLVFNVEVVNQREEEVLVTPEQFYLALPSGIRVPAINPETHLFSLDVESSRREANLKNGAIALGVLSVATLAAGVAADIHENKEVSNANALDNTVVNDGGILDNTANALNAAMLTADIAIGLASEAHAVRERDPGLLSTQERDYWSDFTLRRTTLRKGENVKGRVIFLRQDAMRDFLFMIPVEQRVFSFGFKQRVFMP